METWPEELQQLLNVDSFSIRFGNTLIRSEVDVGLAKVRSRYTAGIDIYTCSIDMDMELYPVLTEFYKTTLNNGAGTFTFIDPMTSEAAEFRFAETPSITPLGGRIFRVGMTWERLVDGSVTDATSDGSDFVVSSAYDVTNGQSATDLGSEAYDGETYRQIDFFASIERGTTVMASMEFSLFYKNSTWVLVTGAYRGDVHGVTFSISQVGTVVQLKAALNSGAGDGEIVLKKSFFVA